MKMNYTNTAPDAELIAPVSGSGATLNVDTVTGFPAVPFYVIVNPDANEEEVMRVTAVSGTVLTVERGVTDQGVASGSGNSHATGSRVLHGAVASDFNNLAAVFDALSDPSQPGAVVPPMAKPPGGLVWGDLL
jgi:hypothetical protein